MLKAVRSYEEACRTFRWRIPERYNLAFDICDRQTMAGADGHRTALIVDAGDGQAERYTFHVLRLLSNRLANVLAAKGVKRGDRVALSFGPSAEAVVGLLAILKMGAVAVPIPTALGEIPLAWRLADSGAVAALADSAMAARMQAVKDGAPDLATILGTEEMWQALEGAHDAFSLVVTRADEPGFIFYPPDPSGKPAGVQHAHKVLPGNLPAMEFALGLFPQFGDIIWTSAEWMSFEALCWALLPAWHHGVPVVAGAHAAEPEQQLVLMGRHGVRAAWLPPRDLARLTQAAATRPHPMPRALASGPAPLDPALHEQVLKVWGTQANEIWGVPETGGIAANNPVLMELRPGSPGRATPGVTVEAVDLTGRPVRAGERGVLAVAPGAPASFLGYWNNLPGTAIRLASGWQVTGHAGTRDLDGYLWPEPVSLAEGVVLVEGRRVSLDDIQAALAWHPKVAAAGVTAAEDEIKAWVVLRPGETGDHKLAQELQAFVANRRSTHEVPRRIEFTAELPKAPDGSLDRAGLVPQPMRLDAPSPEDRLGRR